MLRVRDAAQVGAGIGEKVFGLSLEVAGTLIGNERMRDRGRRWGEAGTERLRAVEEEIASASRRAEARAHEAKERTYRSGRSSNRGPGEGASAPRAAAESVEGTVKELAGKAIGSDALRDEGREQKERGKDEAEAADHEAKARVHREKAAALREAAERR
jgi:uncharacterized protein YjbJ (UPF0337 family)